MKDEKCRRCMYKCWYSDCHSNDPCYCCKDHSNFKEKEDSKESDTDILSKLSSDNEIRKAKVWEAILIEILQRLPNGQKTSFKSYSYEDMHIWADIVKVNGKYNAEIFPISGEMDDESHYRIDDFIDAVANKYGVNADDVQTYVMDNIDFDPSALPFGAEYCGHHLFSIYEN